MTNVENKSVGEVHGCIVCGRIFNVLAVYNPDGKLVDCTVTSSGGRIVPDIRQPLTACTSHSAKEVEAAYSRWQASKGEKSQDEQEDQ